jgi:hypothetical protein
MTHLSKQDRKALRRQAEAHQRAGEAASMPLSLDQLKALLDFLDAHADGCDHSLRETLSFLRAAGLDVEAVVPWLESHGGFCDCEVLANLEDVAREFEG